MGYRTVVQLRDWAVIYTCFKISIILLKHLILNHLNEGSHVTCQGGIDKLAEVMLKERYLVVFGGFNNKTGDLSTDYFIFYI